MSSSRERERTLAYPEPPASLCWHRHGPAHRPLTPEQQRHNREVLALALSTSHRRPRTTSTTTGRTS